MVGDYCHDLRVDDMGGDVVIGRNSREVGMDTGL